MNQTLLAVLVAFTTLLAAAQDAPEPIKFADVADTWIRTNNENYKGEKEPTLEFRYAPDNENNPYYFYALLGFEYSLPEGMKVESATLHFVTERVKGSEAKIYAYANDFEEKTTYGTEKDYVQSTLEGSPITTVVLKGGKNGKAMFECNDDDKDITKWTNAIDVTSYIRSLGRVSRVNFLLAQDNKNQNMIYAKEWNTGGSDSYKTNLAKSADWRGDADLTPYLEVMFVVDADNVTTSVGALSDTWVRSNAASNSYGGEDQMQIANWADGKFCGLMEFALPVDIFDTDKYEVTNVTLRLFHKMNQGSKELALYPYEPGFDENSKFETVGEDVNAAIGTTPIITYTANGQNGKACWDNGLTEEYRNTAAWTNNLDITAHVKTLVERAKTRAATPRNLAFVVAKTGVDELGNNNSVKTVRISTKEATDIVNNNYKDVNNNLTFAQKDIQPLLTVSYAKKDNPTGIQAVEVEMENSPVEYYNLNGLKVSGDNMAPGIYVRRQGTKTTKILVK